MEHNTYLKHLTEAIQATHGCLSVHVESVPIEHHFKGEKAWKGKVEIFNLVDHPKAKRCYAWGYEEKGQITSTCVLEIPPVDSPQTAVMVALGAAGKQV